MMYAMMFFIGFGCAAAFFEFLEKYRAIRKV